MTFISNPKQEEGGDLKTNVIDISGRELLVEMIIILKRIEYQLSLLTNTDISNDRF